MSRISLDSPTLCSCLFFTTFPRSFSPAYSCSDLSCSLLSNGSMATQKDVADPSEEKLLGLEACQLQILGLETFGELREAKMMRLRQNGVRGRERYSEVLAQKKVHKMVGECLNFAWFPSFWLRCVWPMKSRDYIPIVVDIFPFYSTFFFSPLDMFQGRWHERCNMMQRWLRIQTLSHAPAVEETEATPAAVIPLGNARTRWSFQREFRIYSINGGFLKWGYPKMDGL